MFHTSQNMLYNSQKKRATNMSQSIITIFISLATPHRFLEHHWKYGIEQEHFMS